jgi:hypothetical protein
MAKAAWCSASPTSGSAGTTTVNVGGTAHTGRSNRSTTLTFQTTEGSPQQTKELDVIQLAAGDILTNTAPGSIGKAGGSVTISGTSNAKALGFLLSDIPGFTLSNLQISTDGGSSWKGITSIATISGDPGAAAVYQWRCTVTATANTTALAKSVKLSVYNPDETPTPWPNPSPDPEANKSLTISITQSSGDASLSLNKTSLNLVAAGTQQAVTVESNTSYSIS